MKSVFTPLTLAPAVLAGYLLTPLAMAAEDDAALDTVIVTGCTTSGCVRATIVDAFSYGFRVLVPDECCGDAEEGPHRANLADVGRRYADVTTMAEVVKYLNGLSAAR